MLDDLIGRSLAQLSGYGRRLRSGAIFMLCGGLMLLGALIFGFMALYDVLISQMSHRAAALLLGGCLFAGGVIAILIGRNYLTFRRKRYPVATQTPDILGLLTGGPDGKSPLSPLQLAGLALLAGFLAGRRRRRP